ncbi:MAG: lipid-A-disaccharide synthase, partial [Cyclobacteriaceae bacterium]
IHQWKPDVVILIDYPGFNLRIAEFAKQEGYRTCYYISPKIWAWNQKRAYKIKKFVDRMFCILPFEKDFYDKFDYEVDYVGNPLTDSIQNYEYDETLIEQYRQNTHTNIAILPGSRHQEVSNMLATISTIFENHPDVIFHIAGVDNLPYELYREAEKIKNVKLHINKAYDILSFADGALVTSGTATLETALFDVPQVVCYKTSAITYQIAKRLIKIKYISLVNLVVDAQVVDELIQHQFNSQTLSQFVVDVVNNTPRIKKIMNGYQRVHKAIGNDNTSATTAKLIYDYLQN